MKAILVIETDAKHIEDLNIETIWNDDILIDLGKEVHFKPMPSYKAVDLNDTRDVVMFCHGWNTCLNEITGETE